MGTSHRDSISLETGNVNAGKLVNIYKNHLFYVQKVGTNALFKKMAFPTVISILILIKQTKSGS